MNKDIEVLMDEVAELPGWRVELGGKHYKVWPADGSPMLTVPTTPRSAYRTKRNIVAALRRRGADI